MVQTLHKILVAPSNLAITVHIRYGSPPHVDERHRHRYEVCCQS
jgi:CTP synthase